MRESSGLILENVLPDRSTLYHVLNEHLQQHALVKIICIVDEALTIAFIKDKMTDCGWTVVVEEGVAFPWGIAV